jgi:hypothetical protein
MGANIIIAAYRFRRAFYVFESNGADKPRWVFTGRAAFAARRVMAKQTACRFFHCSLMYRFGFFHRDFHPRIN